jgi:tRNA-uridine 2-sulfurtransferase
LAILALWRFLPPVSRYGWRVERVIVAMSGGVDSSVAAARLVAEGCDVVGVTLHLWDYPADASARSRCCAPEDIHDARRVADRLKIPHYAFDRRELFRREVVDPFIDGYLEGKTPSPCVRCNRGVKLSELLGLADRLDATAVATGHYARIGRDSGGPYLMRARDRSKDQSYFLHMVGAAALQRLRFPLGDATKTEVRAQALELELPGADKGESQELCFVPSGGYGAFVAGEAASRTRPGPILDAAGRVVGRHAGIHGFTIGQRKNLGVAIGERAYVTGIDPEAATVQLGPREALARRSALLDELALAPGITLPLRCDVAVRYRGQTTAADVTASGPGRARVAFREDVSAVVPGQYAVFYSGERVLGGGAITAALVAHAAQPEVVA